MSDVVLRRDTGSARRRRRPGGLGDGASGAGPALERGGRARRARGHAPSARSTAARWRTGWWAPGAGRPSRGSVCATSVGAGAAPGTNCSPTCWRPLGRVPRKPWTYTPLPLGRRADLLSLLPLLLNFLGCLLTSCWMAGNRIPMYVLSFVIALAPFLEE